MHRRHPFRPLVGFVLAGLVATLAFTSAGVAKEPAAVSGGDTIQATYGTPQGLSNEPVNVMVQLAGKTVAEVMAEQGKITASAKADIKAALSAPQDAIKPAIQSVGGQVLADYQVAYNGIKVRIAPNLMDRLRALPGVIGVHLHPEPRASRMRSASPTSACQPCGVARTSTEDRIARSRSSTPGSTTRTATTVPRVPSRPIAEYNAANAADTLPANPALFGPGAPKVKGGFDFVGDDYNASGTRRPADSSARSQPARLQRSRLPRRAEPRPASACSRTAAPSAVRTTRRATRRSASSASARASLLERTCTPSACSVARARRTRPSTRSSGRSTTAWTSSTCRSAPPSGTSDDPSAVAADNAAQAGIVVVTSAGNSGPSPYITGSPGTGTHVVSTAANESLAGFPGFTLTPADRSVADHGDQCER